MILKNEEKTSSPGVSKHTQQFFLSDNSQAVKQAVKVVFWQQKIEKDKMQRKQRKKKESTTQLTLLILIYPRINK